MAIIKVNNTSEERSVNFLTNQSSILYTSDTNKITFISSKWDKIIEEKRAKILAKEAAKAAEKQTNNSGETA